MLTRVSVVLLGRGDGRGDDLDGERRLPRHVGESCTAETSAA